ncbi:hypothetical protein R3P38DRAFT_3199203 [Favolaschia claudopus]|uniref:F-box domain-containing protein n=1 Tax=Favolaschia claudopus TaxID=2862362 RepID=A0AAW0B142_9AGAR
MLSQLSDDDLEERFLDIVSSASVAYAPELSLDYIKYVSSVENAIVSKINSLPDEILVAILILVPERFHQGPELWSTACRRLARICRDWRRIIRGTLCFRSSFCFQPGTPLSDIRAFDNITSDVPVSLAFHFLEEDTEHSDVFHQWLEACVDALSGCLARCRFVHIKVENVALSRLLLSQLRSVEAVRLRCAVVAMTSSGYMPGDELPEGRTIYPMFGGQMPIIEELTMTGDITHWTTPLVYSSLTSLTLERLYNTSSVSVHEFFLLLRQSPMLQHICLDWVTFYDYDEDTSDPPRMRHLTHLRLVVHSSRAFQPVSQLVMPVLANLYYEATSDEAVLQLMKRFEKIGQNVERLAIRSGIPAADTFLEIDRLLPSNHPLNARGCTHSFCYILHAIALHWPAVLPRLRHVVIDEYLLSMSDYANTKVQEAAANGLTSSTSSTPPGFAVTIPLRDVVRRYELTMPFAFDCIGPEAPHEQFHISHCFLVGR